MSAAVYRDTAGNTYRVERASNRMFVVVRINPGGHRKAFKGLPEERHFVVAQKVLDETARESGWKEVAQ